MAELKPVAGATTVYHRHSHADVIFGKILEGPNYDGKNLYGIKLVSLYVDQFPASDMSVALAKKYGVRLCKSIEEALTLGGDKLAVEGFISVGEHGNYPKNGNGTDTLSTAKVLRRSNRRRSPNSKKSVPVFNDKHLAATWTDAKWMYDKARELMFPFMAGSTIPLTWRKPNLQLPRGCELVDAVAVGYGPVEGYGFHMLEGLQCMVERRKGGEVGVKGGAGIDRRCDVESLRPRRVLEVASGRSAPPRAIDCQGRLSHHHRQVQGCRRLA